MTSEVKPVRILTKSEQKQTIKGVQKPKKNIIKNYLESPFALEWPKLTPEDEEEVAALLRKSCLGLKQLYSKPPWKEVGKYKGDERKAFLKEHYKQFLENLDPDSIKMNKKREEALSHMIFGYNSVMRAMEQDRVAAILLEKNVKPNFVTKAFLPGCAKKCIPLVPLTDLEKVLRDKETLALPHTCMALGLKPSVKDESNLFYQLYTKVCEALSVEECDGDSSEDEEDCREVPDTDTEEKERPKPSNQPTEVDISSCHLKRSNIKGRRAFIPGMKELQMNESNLDDDFLSFGTMQNQQELLKLQASTTKPNKASENLQTIPAVDENIDFSSMILLDASGDQNPLVKKSNAEKLAKNKGKVKQKRKKPDSDPYVPAKTKLLKGNPNRKGRVM